MQIGYKRDNRSFFESSRDAVKNYNEFYENIINDYEDKVEENNKFLVAEKQDKINTRNEDRAKTVMEDTGLANEYWNDVVDWFGITSMRTTEVKDGRIYDSRNKPSGLYDSMSKEQLIDVIKNSEEDETAEYILYQKKIPVGLNLDGSIKYGYKNGIAKNSLWERDKQTGADNGEELMWAKRIAGAKDIESRINQIAYEEKNNVFDIGNSSGTKDNLGSGYTEIQKESFLDIEQFNSKDDIKSFLRNDLAKQASKDKYRREHGDTGLLNYVTAIASGSLRLVGDFIDLGATVTGYLADKAGLQNDLANGNWGDRLSESADDLVMYNRKAAETAMTEAANRWENGDYVGALLNTDSLDMAEAAFESLPEMAIMTMGFGTGATAKAASLATGISVARNSALASNDALKFAQIAKKEGLLYSSVESATLKEAMTASRFMSATSEILKANAGLEAIIAKNTNNVIERRIENGDDDVTIGEATAILFTQAIATSLDKASFMHAIKGNATLKESIKELMPSLTEKAKKSLMAKVSVATLGVATAMGIEAAQEHIQTWTEIFGKDLGVNGKGVFDVLDSKKNQHEVLKATLAGAASGGVLHAIPEAYRTSTNYFSDDETKKRVKRAARVFGEKLNPNGGDVMMAEMMDFEDLQSDEFTSGAKFHYVNTTLLNDVINGNVDMEVYVNAYDDVVQNAGIEKNKEHSEFADRKFARIVVASFGDNLKGDHLKRLKEVTDDNTFSYVLESIEDRARDRVNKSVEDIMAEHVDLGSDQVGKNVDGFDDEFYMEYDDDGNLIEKDEINPLFGVFTDEIVDLESDIANIREAGGDAFGLIDVHTKLREINDSTKPPKDMSVVASEIATAGLTINGKKIAGYGSINEHIEDIADSVTSLSDSMADIAPLNRYLRFVKSRGNLLDRTEKGKLNSTIIDQVTSENKALFAIGKTAKSALMANTALSKEKKDIMIAILDDAERAGRQVSNRYAEILFNDSNFKLASEHSQARPLGQSELNQIVALASNAKTLEELNDVTKVMKQNFYYPPDDLDMTATVDYISAKKRSLETGKYSKKLHDAETDALVEVGYASQNMNLMPIDDDLFHDLTKNIKTPEDQVRILGLLENRKLSKAQMRKMIGILSNVKEPEIDPQEEPALATTDKIKQLKVLAERANGLNRKGNKNLKKELENIDIIARGLGVSDEALIKYYYSNMDDDIQPVNKDDIIGSIEGLIYSLKYDDDLQAADIRAYRDQVIKEATDTINNMTITKRWITSLEANGLIMSLKEIIDNIWRRLHGLEKKSKSQIALIDKLGEYASKIDNGGKIHRLSIESLKRRLGVETKGKAVSIYSDNTPLETEVVEDSEQKQKLKRIGFEDRKRLVYKKLGESIDMLVGQKRLAYKKKLEKINNETDSVNFFKQMEKLASLVKKETIKLIEDKTTKSDNQLLLGYRKSIEIIDKMDFSEWRKKDTNPKQIPPRKKYHVIKYNDNQETETETETETTSKPDKKKRLDRRAEELLLDIQRANTKYGKEDGVPELMRTVMGRLRVPVKTVIMALRFGSMEEKNRSVTSMLNVLVKRFEYEVETAFDHLDGTIEYANELSSRIKILEEKRDNLEIDIERKDIRLQTSSRLKKRHKSILKNVRILFAEQKTIPDKESKLDALNQILSLVTQAVRISPNDTEFAVKFVETYSPIMEELSYELVDAEYHQNIKEFKKVIRYSNYGLVSLVEKVETSKTKLNDIVDKYLEKRETIVKNIDAKNKQLELIASMRSQITDTTLPALEDIMALISSLESKYIMKESNRKIEPSSTSSMFIEHGNTKNILSSRPTILSYIGDAIAMFRQGKSFDNAMHTIVSFSNSILNVDDGINKVVRAINIIGSLNAETMVKEFFNLNINDGVITPQGQFFNLSGLLVNENNKVSALLSEAVKQSALLAAPSFEDTRFSILRYDLDEFKKYFGISSEEEMNVIKDAAINGYVPTSFMKKETRRILMTLLGVTVNNELDIKSADLVKSGMGSLVHAGIKALAQIPNAPYSFMDMKTSEEKTYNIGFVKVNLSKDDIDSLRTVMHLTGSNRKGKPSLKPFKARRKVKNSTAEITDYDLEQLQQRNNTKNFFTDEARYANDIWIKDPNKLYRILGFMTDDELDMLSVKDRRIAEITNETIIRFTDDLFSNYGLIQDKPFYLDHFVMRSGRTSSSGEITPFESKLQRLFLTKDSFRKTEKVPSVSDKREPVRMVKDGKDDFTEIEQFEIALAGHLGIKTDARSKFYVFSELRKIIDIYADEDEMLVDKSGKFDYIKEIIDNRMANHLENKSALEIFENPAYKISNKLNRNNTSYQTIKAAMAIKNLVEAKTLGSEEFSTNLTFFADAISSGPANITMQSGESGEGYQSMLEKAGILTDEQLERRTRYTKFLLSKKYDISEDDVTFNMASLIEAGKFHSDESTDQAIKDEASKIDDVFYDIYETVGSALFKSFDPINVDIEADTIEKKSFYAAKAMRKFAEIILDGRKVITLSDARSLAKSAVMVRWYGAQESSIKRNYIREDVFDAFYDSANSQDKELFETIVFSMNTNSEISDENQKQQIITEFLNNRKNFEKDMPKELVAGERLPYLKLSKDVFEALRNATESIFGDVIAKKITYSTPLQAGLVDSIKSVEPIVFAMSKVILDNEVNNHKKNNNNKITKKKYVEILNKLAKDGNAHAIYTIRRIHSFYKEERIEAEESLNSIESISLEAPNSNNIYVTDSDKVYSTVPTSAFGGFATLYIHSKDGEAMAAGLDGTDYTSVYDEIEFPASTELMNESADRYQDSIHLTGKADFAYGSIVKHIIKMRKYIRDNGLDEELIREFELAKVNSKEKITIDEVRQDFPLVLLKVQEPHISIMNGKVSYQKYRNGTKIYAHKFYSRTYSNGMVEDSVRFFSKTGENGSDQEVLRIVKIFDISGSVVEHFALVTDFSFKDEAIKNKRKLSKVELNPNIDTAQAMIELRSNPDLLHSTIEVDHDGGIMVYDYDQITNKTSNHVATVHELKSDYLIRSGFNSGYENAMDTLYTISENRNKMYAEPMNVAHLNTLGVEFKRIEATEDKDEIDNVSTEDIFTFGSIYSELQDVLNVNVKGLKVVIAEEGKENIKNYGRIENKKLGAEDININAETLDIIKQYLTDENKGC